MERIKKDEGETPTMNENLSQLVQDTPPTDTGVIFSETDLDLPVEETIVAPVVETQETPATSETAIPITTLASWFEAYKNTINNINQVVVQIRGIDSDKTLIMAVKDGDGEVDADGNDKRTLRVFDNADSIPVLNLNPVMMDVYNNGFQIIYQQGDTFIKTYGVRTGLICTLCINVGGKLLPYSVVRVKKKDDELVIPNEAPTITDALLNAPADLEKLQLLYKQSAKSVDEMTTVQSVIDWMLDRQASVTDINHHLQIDNVLIDILQ